MGATGKVGSMTPSEAADGDLAGGSGGGRHDSHAVSVARERQREKDLCLDSATGCVWWVGWIKSCIRVMGSR